MSDPRPAENGTEVAWLAAVHEQLQWMNRMTQQQAANVKEIKFWVSLFGALWLIGMVVLGIIGLAVSMDDTSSLDFGS